MKITKVKFYDTGIHKNSKFLACCSVVLDNTLMLNGIRVLDGEKGRYIIMPSKDKYKSNTSMKTRSEDVFHPVEHSFSLYMSEVVLKGYEEFEKTKNFVYLPNFGGCDGQEKRVKVL